MNCNRSVDYEILIHRANRRMLGYLPSRIQILCGEGRVPGAIRIGTVWGIPEDAEKPADARIKNGKYIKKPVENEK